MQSYLLLQHHAVLGEAIWLFPNYSLYSTCISTACRRLCSKIFTSTEVAVQTGQLFSGSPFLSFLEVDVILSFFQSLGTSPANHDYSYEATKELYTEVLKASRVLCVVFFFKYKSQARIKHMKALKKKDQYLVNNQSYGNVI